MDIKNKSLIAVSLLFILILSTIALAFPKIIYSNSLTDKEKAIYNATILEINNSIDLSEIKEINILNNCYLKEDDNRNKYCSDKLGFASNHYNGTPNQYKINIYNAKYQIKENIVLFVLLHEIRHTQHFSLDMDSSSKLISPILEAEWKKENYISTSGAYEIDANNYANEHKERIKPKQTTTTSTTTTTILSNITQPIINQPITIKPKPTTTNIKLSFWQKILNVF